ncbi:MAG: stealth family protein [Bacteroidales bacterium]|nr:stealth family protein [Bacteroidales bacterium]
MTDIVITWVDSNDPNWVDEYNKYVPAGKKKIDADISKRYNENGLLKYVLRSIEANCKWVNKIYLVTCGHLPNWINITDNLIHVKHEDFIPEQFLPTFNSATINLNLHNINGLEENFIYANDDMIFLSKTKEEDFFRKGLPCDIAIQDVNGSYKNDYFYHMILNDMTKLNTLYKKKAVIKKHPFKWFNFKYGIKGFVKNCSLSRFALFSGFYEPHSPAPYKKSEFNKIWETFPQDMALSCQEKFRSPYCNTENLMRWSAICSGNFHPYSRHKNSYYSFMNDSKLLSIINKKKYKMLCINYDSTPEKNKAVLEALEKVFPNKSKYEK